jgi:hypothetical protein
MKTWRLKKKDNYSFAYELSRNIDTLKNTNIDDLADTIRLMNVTIYSNEKVNTSPWIRLTIIFIPIIFIPLFIFLPINYMITGHWGYNIKWLKDWVDALGI